MDRSEIIKNGLNGICPYFTMFPLSFPFSILHSYAARDEWVLDPFCGRGTTNFASRLLGLPSVGIDSNPVAAAITQAKIAKTTPKKVLNSFHRILDEIPLAKDIPEGEFWDLCFHKDVLLTICRLREGLIANCRSETRKALRGIIIGALHGPRPKSKPSYFSNQCQRTYAPKPRYAVNFWKKKNLFPEPVDVLEIIETRAYRYYGEKIPSTEGLALCGDSRKNSIFSTIGEKRKFKWTITSPPYYGMRTYIPDQWLRAWFIGGTPKVDYSQENQIRHESPAIFISELKQVWTNVGQVSTPGASLIVRFGAINDRKNDPKLIIKESLSNTHWKIREIVDAGSASFGKRQAIHFAKTIKPAREEFDLWAVWEG